MEERKLNRQHSTQQSVGLAPLHSTQFHDRAYLKQILFNRSSRGAREVTASLVQSFMEAGPRGRRRELIDTLTSFLSEVGRAGEASQEFINLYRKVGDNRKEKISMFDLFCFSVKNVFFYVLLLPFNK